MKVSIEIDLNPDEARELMGWPNMGQLHEQFLKLIREQMKTGETENVNFLMQPFLNETQKNFALYQKMMESFMPSNSKETKKDK